MRNVFGGAFLLVGLFMTVAGCGMAMTGRNLPGRLGGARNKSDELRLQRAPTAYFRAMGTLFLSFGLLVVMAGIVFLTIPETPSAVYVVASLGLAGLLMAALIASGIWLFVVSARYKLFRWDKP